MNLEQQCISLEYAKRLKELNVNQESLFYYADDSIVCSVDMDLLLDTGKVRSMSYINNSWPDQDIDELYSAFTASDLLELLPHRINTKENEPFNSYRLRVEKGIWCLDSESSTNIRLTEFYSVNYYCDTTSQKMDWMFKSLTNNVTDENCANALAKMLIFLIESDLLNVKDS